MSDAVEPYEQAADALMTRYGVKRVSEYHYHYKHYRYSRLSDAIAQAKRDMPSA